VEVEMEMEMEVEMEEPTVHRVEGGEGGEEEEGAGEEEEGGVKREVGAGEHSQAEMCAKHTEQCGEGSTVTG
jgi:hypothetical protein